MTGSERGWVFADAWVLTAIAVSTRPCSLTDIVAAGDGLNHALLLDAEVDGALGKLQGSGLVLVMAELRFDLTPEGAALVERRRGNLLSQIDSVLSLLGQVPDSDQQFALPPGALQDAVDAYKARSRKH
ncbi:hypothetical protein EUA06_19835 [Nocardioides glacieisoli]|uniref:Uncharacterized protein n=1 Tax=Nocardioides glacieisoli TaxID=1168730 RepID=A0A4Q2RMD0_9ACTN|nr:hypothetical protein [Nocardioides glacieisoli]RYB88745.1 hypothetical protein EUA06_19835 [Nocardioides glacieisoli]